MARERAMQENPERQPASSPASSQTDNSNPNTQDASDTFNSGGAGGDFRNELDSSHEDDNHLQDVDDDDDEDADEEEEEEDREEVEDLDDREEDEDQDLEDQHNDHDEQRLEDQEDNETNTTMTETSALDELKRKNREQSELLRQAEEIRKRLQLNCELMQGRLDEALAKVSQLERSNERLQAELEALAKSRQLDSRSIERLQGGNVALNDELDTMSDRNHSSRSNSASPVSLDGEYSVGSSAAASPLGLAGSGAGNAGGPLALSRRNNNNHQAHLHHGSSAVANLANGLNLNSAVQQLTAGNQQRQQHQQHQQQQQQQQQHQEQQSTAVALAAASQFLSALARSQVGGQLSELDRLAQSHLLASTLGAAAANVSATDMATNLTNHLAKHQQQQQQQPQQQHHRQPQHHHHHHQSALNGSALLNSSHVGGGNATTDNNNNNTSASHHNHQLRPASVAQQLASVAASAGLAGAGSPAASAAAAAVAAQLSAAAAAAAAARGSLGASSGATGAGVVGNNHQQQQQQQQPPTSLNQQQQPQQIVGSIPHPHSHHALSHPAASLLINNPHYQTVRTKYSTRRYSRRRVGPEEAMADPAIRATVQLKMPVVPKTILIVLRHRLTVQTAITLACARTGERLRKGAIQKKLEAMFREPGAVDAFLAEWDQPR